MSNRTETSTRLQEPIVDTELCEIEGAEGVDDLQYNTLQNDQFRLIKITRNTNGLLHFELDTYDIAHAPSYYALSYTWGSQDNTIEILINGRSFSARHNMIEALAYLGKFTSDQDQLLWIDAICINQSNEIERSHQVRLMKQIYDKADTVLVWLGPVDDAEDFKLAVMKMHKVSHVVAGLFVNDCPPNEFHGKILAAVQQDPSLLYPGASGSEDARAWKGIFKLLTRSWWSRAWIVQEATRNVPTRLFCGNIGMVWTWFECLSYFMQTIALVGDDHEPLCPAPLRYLQSISYLVSSGERARLLDTLSDFRWTSCTDPRDKVYGALGLTTEPEDQLPVPDYAKSVKEVYLDVVRCSTRFSPHCHVLDFLGHAQGAVGSKLQCDIPTWLPDWSIQTSPAPFPKEFHNDNAGKHVYNAGCAREAEIIFDCSELQIKGFVVDRIHRLLDLDELIQAVLNIPSAIMSPMQIGVWKGVTGDLVWKDGQLVGRGNRYSMLDMKLKYSDILPKEVNRKLETQNLINRICGGRQGFMLGRDPYTLGVGPKEMQCGDKICVFFGGQMLYVLREAENGKHIYLGECFIDGLMDGEAFGLLKENDSTIQSNDEYDDTESEGWDDDTGSEGSDGASDTPVIEVFTIV